MKVAFITHPDCSRHDMGAGHPERPARLAAIRNELETEGLEARLRPYEAPLATRAQLERVHAPDYVEALFREAPTSGLRWIDADTAMNPATMTAALRAAGAVVLGVELVCSGEMDRAFCSIRPPGHHAARSRAMGFCFFNNIAVGAAHALALYGIERVAVIDFDVHHGNGTEDIFRDEPRVLLCSSFQHPFYPYLGSDSVSEHILNVPLASGSGSAEFRDVVRKRWLQPLNAFAPQLIVISAGFDAHVDDPMSGLRLVEQDFAWITGEVCAVANTFARGRVVSALEGGYDLPSLGRSVAAHVRELLA